MLLGVRAVIAESFERIHRANLVSAGVLPLQFANGENRNTLALSASDCLDLIGLEGTLKPGAGVRCIITRDGERRAETRLTARLDTSDEVDYFRQGGLLRSLLRRKLNER
jgi:aconitate hydratase